MRIETVCPHCRRPYPPKFQVSGPVRQRIVNIIARRPAGICRADLISLVYADDPNGGPLYPNSVSVLVHHANKELRKQGYEITAGRGRGALYRLVKYNADTVCEPTRDRNAGSVERTQPANPAWVD